MKNDVRVALSIRQPWAWLIINGHKDIENRSWPTKFRGSFYVHSSKTFDEAGYELVRAKFSIEMPQPSEFERGGLMGTVKLIDCVTSHTSAWFEGPYGFVLSDSHRIDFVSLAGKMGFFAVNLL